MYVGRIFKLKNIQKVLFEWPLTARSDRATWQFLKLDIQQGLKIIGTCNITLPKIQNLTFGKIIDKDMQHCNFLKSTFNIGGPNQGPQLT